MHSPFCIGLGEDGLLQQTARDLDGIESLKHGEVAGFAEEIIEAKQNGHDGL